MLTGGALKSETAGSPTPTNIAQQRWDTPFGDKPLHPQYLSRILSLPILSRIKAADFPDDLPLAELIANDGRVRQFDCGDTVYDADDFGDSIFIVLNGHVRLDAVDHGSGTSSENSDTALWSGLVATLSSLARRRANQSTAAEVEMPRVEPLLEEDVLSNDTLPLPLGPSELFGLVSALRRNRRGETAIACEDDTQLLELRWPGVRDLRFWSADFRDLTDELYLSRCRLGGLRESRLFASADDELIEFIAENSMVETFGERSWSHALQRHSGAQTDGSGAAAHEPVIVEQGEFVQDILIVGSGIVRASHRLGRYDQIAGFYMAGDIVGPPDTVDDLKGCDGYPASHRLTACGYADVIRVPLQVVAYAQHVIANVTTSRPLALPEMNDIKARGIAQPVRDFIIDHHLVNGTTAMVINLDRCVNCNDCVRACAATHDGVARFERRGKVHHSFVVAQACMHCRDPVCLIDCPTGAIHRLADNGNVVIESASCIGCGACANACPYGSIRMEVTGIHGAGEATAVKCDLCAGQSGGPACKRACPHDAIERVDLADAEALPDWIRAV